MVDVIARRNDTLEIVEIEVPDPGKFTLKEIQQMLNSVGLTYAGVGNWKENT